MLDTKLVKQRRARYYARLRSNREKQGRSCLKTREKYCCLGIACLVYQEEFPENKWTLTGPMVNDELFLSERLDLPKAVQEYFGFTERNPRVKVETLSQHGFNKMMVKCLDDMTRTTCTVMNDHLFLNFKQIADVLETEYPAV